MEYKSTAKEPGALATLFMHEYLHAKSLYLYLTGKIPSVAFINEVDPFGAANAFRTKYEQNIADWHNDSIWNHDTKSLAFVNTFFVLDNGVIIEFGHDYAQVLYSLEHFEFVDEVLWVLSEFKKDGDQK
jgi:hypothetical protein